MAWIGDSHGDVLNGKWLDRERREQLIKEYEEESRLLTKLIKSDRAFDHDFNRLEFLLDELERLKRIHRAEYDVLYFGFTYFSDDYNPENQDNLIPSGTHLDNAAKFHRILCDMFDDIAKGIQETHVAWACPRSHGKTAWISNIFLIHQIVFRHKKYIVLFSETTDVAGDFITWGRYQLKLNERLREDFGQLLDPRPSKNETDNKYEYITSSGAKVEAKGLGTQTRGLRHRNSRPDLMILDDLESSESVNTKELIEKSKKWFREEMLPAMSKSGLCVYLGTILCYGSLLHHVITERKDFKSRLFGAVSEFSSETEKWERWREIYREDTEDAPERARAYFNEHKEEMLAGTEVLWPEMHSYYDLMLKRENNGIKAFNQEYQNNPTDEERQIFKPEHFMWFDEEELESKNIQFYGGVDIAMGKEKGDYSVIVTIAKNVDTGTCYVYDVFMERCHPDVLIQKVVEYTLRYQYEGLGIEAQFAQEFIAEQMSRALQSKGYPGHTRINQIKQRTRKQLRIEALLPDIQNGTLRFHRRLKESPPMDQFDMFPMHEHDDFPDAVDMAYRTAKAGAARVTTVKSMARRWR